MNYHEPKRLNAIAQRFVLGTLTRRARRRFNRLVDVDKSVADVVYAIEEELLPMAWSLQGVEPSALVWPRIARQMTANNRSSLTKRSTSRWPLVASMLSVALFASLLGWWQEHQRPSEVIVETVTERVPVEPSVSVVADANGVPLWIARIYGGLQRADIQVNSEPERQTANDYQLWALGDDGVPVSLGLLPQSGERTLTLTPDAIVALEGSTTLAVSLEPLGGSPLATPTGPVLYTAALLAP